MVFLSTEIRERERERERERVNARGREGGDSHSAPGETRERREVERGKQ